MADIKISELERVQSLNNGDLVEVSQEDSYSETGYSSKSAKMTDLGEKVVNGIEYTSELNTSNKKIIGAINEIASYTPVYGNEASGAIATFDTSLALPLQDCTIAINAVQSGSGTPSPSNPRAISGFDSGVVSVCGINVWDEVLELGTIDNVTGAKVNVNNRLRSKNYIRCLPNTNYFAKLWNNTDYGLRLFFYDNAFNFINSPDFIKQNVFTTPNNATYIMFILSTSYGTTYNNDISINYPSSDTRYHAYNGNTYTVDFGQTVYGGSLDVTSGKLTDSMGYIASYNGETIGEPWISDRDEYVAGTIPSIGAKVVYTLATPQTYQLTPTQISAIVGINNVFTDTNGNTSVMYACSLKDYINSQ